MSNKSIIVVPARTEAVYGKAGTPIPGSRMCRWYCWSCGEPIRVTIVPTSAREASLCECEVCSGTKRHLMPGGYAGPVDEDSDGSIGNAQRNLEGI